MREIKFRAWDKKNKEMYYIGQEFDNEYGCAPYLEINKNGEWYWEWGDASDEFDLDNKIGILMQFTGLLDKEGKEIYEGDIVRCLPKGWIKDEFLISKVYYDNNAAEFRGFIKTFNGDKLPETEVIGNIYENPELLNK